MNYKITYKFAGHAEKSYEVAAFTPNRLLLTLTHSWEEAPIWDGPALLEYYRVELQDFK